jgi:L-fuconolactonase
MYIIDAHQHYWKLSRTDYGWLKPEVGRIYADFLPNDLKISLEQFHIHKTVVVQAAPSMELPDNRYCSLSQYHV